MKMQMLISTNKWHDKLVARDKPKKKRLAQVYQTETFNF